MQVPIIVQVNPLRFTAGTTGQDNLHFPDLIIVHPLCPRQEDNNALHQCIFYEWWTQFGIHRSVRPHCHCSRRCTRPVNSAVLPYPTS